MSGIRKVHHTGLVDEGNLAYTVAEELADRGYVMCFNGRSSAVYDATVTPPARIRGTALAEVVEELALLALDYTAADAERHATDRAEARNTAALLRTRSEGYTAYMRRVVAMVRDELPPVDRDVVCPPRDRREYMAEYNRRHRTESLERAEAAALAVLPKMIPTGKYELGEVWEGWCGELEDPDSGLIEKYPELLSLGRNRFYDLLPQISGMRVAKGSGRRRYLYVK